MTKLLMRSECAAPSWAWCCCARGMNCGRRWAKAARSLREGPYDRNGPTIVRRFPEAPRRNDLLVVYRAATGSRASTRSFRAHAGMRRMPHAAARAGARIAAAHARDARGRGGASGEAGAVSRAGAQVHALDLDFSLWFGGHRSLCAVRLVRGAVAAGTGKSRFWRLQSFEFADFSRRLLERMATDDRFVGGARAGHRGGIWLGVFPAARAAELRVGAGAGGILRGDRAAAGLGVGLGDPQRRISGRQPRRNDQRRYFPVWRSRAHRWHGGWRCISLRT